MTRDEQQRCDCVSQLSDLKLPDGGAVLVEVELLRCAHRETAPPPLGPRLHSPWDGNKCWRRREEGEVLVGGKSGRCWLVEAACPERRRHF